MKRQTIVWRRYLMKWPSICVVFLFNVEKFLFDFHFEENNNINDRRFRNGQRTFEFNFRIRRWNYFRWKFTKINLYRNEFRRHSAVDHRRIRSSNKSKEKTTTMTNAFVEKNVSFVFSFRFWIWVEIRFVRWHRSVILQI